MLAAIDNGKEVRRRQYAGQPVPLTMRLKHELFERVIFSKLRERLGLDQCEFRLSGAAPISPELLLFFSAIGLEILEVYGMTESTAVISSNRPGRVKLGTVGVATEGTEMRIAEDGEILSRGPHVTPGYLNRPEATAEAIDDDGWLHTGDLGQIDEDGFLKIIGRKKELIITAGGKNLSPNNIEETIKGKSDIIGQVCAVGDERPFIGALIVLDAEVLPGWCESHGITFESVAQAAEHEQVKAEVARAVEAGNDRPRPGRAGQAVDDPAHRVDARDRGDDADDEAQAQRHPLEVQRHDRRAVHAPVTLDGVRPAPAAGLAQEAAVAVGGVLGGGARIGLSVLGNGGDGIPWGTAVANVSGALLLGYLLTRFLQAGSRTSLTIPLLCTGLLGSYTTFSTFSLEAWELADAGRVGLAAAYALGSVVLGLVAAGVGIRAAERRR